MLHRVIWESVNGPGPVDLEINHRDGRKSHNAITNLELATGSENMLHAFRTGLKHGYQGESSPQAILTEDQVSEIRRLLMTGLSQRALAVRFGVSQSAIYKIRAGRAWTHMPSSTDPYPVITGLLGEANTQSKLTWIKVDEIRLLLADGLSQQAIADRYGVSQHTVSSIKLGKTWRLDSRPLLRPEVQAHQYAVHPPLRSSVVPVSDAEAGP